jgi:YHS domain-containing protein
MPAAAKMSFRLLSGRLALHLSLFNGGVMTIDPVCGKPVDEEKSMDRVDYQGRAFYFCSPECVEVFETDPAPYAKAAS